MLSLIPPRSALQLSNSPPVIIWGVGDADLVQPGPAGAVDAHTVALVADPPRRVKEHQGDDRLANLRMPSVERPNPVDIYLVAVAHPFTAP